MAMIVHLFFYILFLSLLPSITTFTLKLIHRDSPLSPLYQSNLINLQRFIINANASIARASYLHQSNASIRLPIKFQDPIYTVEISIGTPPTERTLIFDTGSGLTWIQCKPCIRCYKQNEPLFDPKKSSSYKLIPKTHPLSKPFTCTSRGCGYYIGYHGVQFTSGVAAQENFTFQTNLEASRKVSNLVFGCAKTTYGNFPKAISGIMGLNKEPQSFARQLGSSIKNRFSYCLTHKNSSYIRFGDDAIIRSNTVKKTPFLNHKRGTSLYGVNILNLSINGEKLGLGQTAFLDGCYIDSGASVGLLNKKLFSATIQFLDKYFGEFKDVGRYVGKKVPKVFHCYREAVGFTRFPSMTFHLKGADYYVPASNLFFYIEENVFCLAMMESKDTTALGAFQQRNVRMVYDLEGRMLWFAQEDCSKDGA